jgi:Zinc-finger associated domain (zf-AD)
MDTLDINCLAQLTKSSCRLCLATESNTSKPSPQAQNLVHTLTNLVISDLDFSSSICQTCIATLTNFGKFRRKCHQISEFLYSHGYCQSRSLPADSLQDDEVESQENKKSEETHSEL